MKTHYQAPWTDGSKSICNETLISPSTATHMDGVDCKRCVRVLESYNKRGIPVRKKSNGIQYLFKVLLIKVKWLACSYTAHLQRRYNRTTDKG